MFDMNIVFLKIFKSWASQASSYAGKAVDKILNDCSEHKDDWKTVDNELVPILLTLQYEDVVQQRIDRLLNAWTLSLESSLSNSKDLEQLKKSIAERLGTSVERASFYPNVMGCKPPEDDVEEITFFD